MVSTEGAAQVLGEVMDALARHGRMIREVTPGDDDRLRLLELAARQAGYLLGLEVVSVRSRPVRRSDGRVVVALLITRAGDDLLRTLSGHPDRDGHTVDA